MPVQNPEINEPKYTAIQWNGDNADEVQAALGGAGFARYHVCYEASPESSQGPSLFLVPSSFVEPEFLRVSPGGWIVSAPYYAEEHRDSIGMQFEIMSDADYQAKFGEPEEEVFP
ncbi:hypothetical protein BJF85_16765 [Saccharomonospora sp. CUA-673]|uniref:hypothetical protein n=1 Tax=Saccharomonospora sp. CUA-673 TaxID=1904969 RepID=UPI00095C57D6|nr:hypothetical protein [Saccharomonospora sp. CUA-673]OLT46495.1 hypothetical protein BJF85_16765 [Saccharomonospora sp. CUA-673]